MEWETACLLAFSGHAGRHQQRGGNIVSRGLWCPLVEIAIFSRSLEYSGEFVLLRDVTSLNED